MVFPEWLKYAILIPLHMNGDVSNMVITDRFLYYQWFWKFLNNQLNQLLQANNILDTEQYGFRKVLATKHVTVSLIDNIGMAWN